MQQGGGERGGITRRVMSNVGYETREAAWLICPAYGYDPTWLSKTSIPVGCS